MDIYRYNNYRDYLVEIVNSRAVNERGVVSSLAKALRIHTSLMSMILSGKRNLSVEQAYDLCFYLELTDAESEFFILLVQKERAGTDRLKKHLEKKMESFIAQSNLVKSRFSDYKTLTQSDQAIFYSHWIYSAIHLFCTIGRNGKNLVEICDEFKLSRLKIKKVLDFLIKTDLLSEDNGCYQVTTKSTLIGVDSPFLQQHRINWRNRALLRVDDLSDTELMVSAPFSVSKNDFTKIREILLTSLKKTTKIINDSDEELVACLNLDLFYVNHSYQEEAAYEV